MPAYFGTGDDPVVAIFDADQCYKICTAERGVLRGEPVLAGKVPGTSVTYFEDSKHVH